MGRLTRTTATLPWRVIARIRTAGWDLTRPAGEFVAADRASPSRRRLSTAPVAGARGWCLIRRHFLTTFTPRRLAEAGAILGRLAVPRGRMGFFPTRRSTSAVVRAPVGPSACVLLSSGRTGASFWLTRGPRRGLAPRRRRTGGALAPQRVFRVSLDGYRVLATPPTALSLSPTSTSGWEVSMRPSTRCVACVRVAHPG